MEQKPIDIEITKCPLCGSEERLGQEILKRYPKPGVLPGAKAPLFTQLVPLAERSLVTGKVLVILEDVCMDCGTRYLVRAFEQVGHIEIKPGKPPSS